MKLIKTSFFKILVAVIAASALSVSLFADTTYTVKKGETLYAISRKYQLTVGELRAANNLKENDVLKEGQKLVIPSADISNAVALSATETKTADDTPKPATPAETKTYTVQKGDTLYGIARKNGMKLPELLALNNLGPGTVLKVNQKLIVASDAERTGAVSPVDKKDTYVIPSSSEETEVKTDSQIVWPVSAKKVVYIKGKVSGVRLSAKTGEEVKSVRSGTVMYTGVYRGFGQVVFVQSKTGLIYAYTGLNSVDVKKGDYSVYGGTIGTAGIDVHTKESQLTFMVFRNGMPMDPAKAPRG